MIPLVISIWMALGSYAATCPIGFEFANLRKLPIFLWHHHINSSRCEHRNVIVRYFVCYSYVNSEESCIGIGRIDMPMLPETQSILLGENDRLRHSVMQCLLHQFTQLRYGIRADTANSLAPNSNILSGRPAYIGPVNINQRNKLPVLINGYFFGPYTYCDPSALILAHHFDGFPSRFSSFLGGLCGFNSLNEHAFRSYGGALCLAQSLPNQINAYASGSNPTKGNNGRRDGRPEHFFSPINHVLLGLKVLFLALSLALFFRLILFGFRFADRGFDLAQNGQKVRGYFAFWLGIFGFCVIAPILLLFVAFWLTFGRFL